MRDDESNDQAQADLDRGVCPDCGWSFVGRLRENGARQTDDGWRWSYPLALRAAGYGE